LRFQVADCSFFRTDFGASAIRLLRSFSLLCDWPFPQCAQTLRNKNSVHRRSAQRPKKVGKELCLRPDLVPSNQSAQWRWDLYIGSELGSWDVVRCTGLSLVRDQPINNFILCLSVTAKSVFGFWKHRTSIIWRRRHRRILRRRLPPSLALHLFQRRGCSHLYPREQPHLAR